MTPVPMRPAHNALAIVATFLVAGALLPWSPIYRLACAAGAIAIVLLLLVARVRDHMQPQSGAGGEMQARIDRIRAERAARMGPRR